MEKKTTTTTKGTGLRTLALLAAGLLTAACGSDEAAQQDDRVALHVTSGIVTRAMDNVWQTGDAIGVFMLDGSAVDTYANVKYVTQNGGTSGSFAAENEMETIYLPVDDTTRDFIAYYPYQTGLTADKTACTISLADQSDLTAIDFMAAAKVEGKSRKDYTAPFVFTHKLSKITMDIQPGAGLKAADLAGMTIALTGQPTTGTFDLLTATDVTPSSDTPSSITLNTAADGSHAEAIVFPSASYEGMAFEFHTQEFGDYTWKLNASTQAKRFEAGKKYRYTITVNRTSLIVSAIITDWAPGNAAGDQGSAE